MDKKIIELLQSEDFSIVYTDNGCCSLFKGKKINLDNIKNELICDFEGDGDGYTPAIVEYLVKALNGTSKTY